MTNEPGGGASLSEDLGGAPSRDDPADAIEALAEAWASIDGKMEKYRACKNDPAVEDRHGYYGGYIADAESLAVRLHARGYEIVESKSKDAAPQKDLPHDRP